MEVLNMDELLNEQIKIQRKLLIYLDKNKPLKIKKLRRFFEWHPEESASMLEHTVFSIIEHKPERHDAILKLFHFFLHSSDSLWFSLYFECLLANEVLYTFLKRGFGYDSHESFYHEMLRLAEHHADPKGKEHALAILMVLYDSIPNV